MHEKVLPPGSLTLLNQLGAMNEDALYGWTLAGGTGLALQVGHRISVDFDFFRIDDLQVRKLHPVLETCGPYETLQDEEDTVTVIIQGVKLSFFRVRDPFLHPRTEYRFFNLAGLRDIALMKLAAISGRGSRKDFIDLYKILMLGDTLSEYFAELPLKYGTSRVNIYHILKSLTWFEDAEREPMPNMLEPFDWEECKAFFIREAHRLVLD